MSSPLSTEALECVRLVLESSRRLLGPSSQVLAGHQRVIDDLLKRKLRARGSPDAWKRAVSVLWQANLVVTAPSAFTKMRQGVTLDTLLHIVTLLSARQHGGLLHVPPARARARKQTRPGRATTA
jgi:hypothetical protein